MQDEQEEPVATEDDEAEAQPDADAPAEVEAEAPAEAEAEAAAPAAEADEDSIEPEVQEYINQDSTVVHSEGDSLEYRTPPGVAPGLVPGGPEDRDPPPRTPS